MPRSPQLKSLERRISILRMRFLPRRFSDIGSYSERVLDNARAFRLLTHAEIEYYFEDRCLDIATTAFDLWKTRHKATPPLIHIVCNTAGEQTGFPKKLGTSTNANTLIGKAFGKFTNSIKQNHGIREENLLQLLLPVGISENDFDSDWLATIDGFGAKRGTAAHLAAIAYQIDPRDDFSTVSIIMGGVKNIDVKLAAIKKSIR